VVIGSILPSGAAAPNLQAILLGMAQPIVYIDRSEIRAGAVADVRAAVARLVAFVERREPQLLAYSLHIDEATSTMWVVAVHPDGDSLELHLRIGGPEFRRVGQFIVLRAIDVYGDIGDGVLELLREKARMLGGATVSVHPPTTGFART
jgi:hypothetical protein